MKQKNYSQSKVRLYFIYFIDIDNILDSNAEKVFLQNISGSLKSNNSSPISSTKSKHLRKKSRLSDYIKKGFLDYSLDSNSVLSQDEQLSSNDEKIKKHKKNKKKHKNFILKSELFSSFENDKKMKSEKISPKPSMLQ